MAQKKNVKKPENNYVVKSFTATMADGSKKRVKVRGKNEKEANKKLARLQAEYEMGLRTLNNNTPFARWVETWLETYKKPSVQASTYTETKRRVAKTFIPDLGNLKVSEIKPTNIQTCINRLEGKANSTIRKNVIDIKSIFKYAAINDIIIKDPTLGIITPAGYSGSRRALTQQEENIFRAVLPKHDKGLMFAISLACGLRPGEVRALTWSNVNLKERTLSVTNAVMQSSLKIKPPKSAAGMRTVPIPAWLADMFALQTKSSLGLVFDRGRGLPYSEQQYMRAWNSFYKLMDIEGGAKLYRNKIIMHSDIIEWEKLTPYYLRHTYATRLAEAGVDMKTAQYLLGHADIKMTAQVYTHVTDKMIDKARNIIDHAETLRAGEVGALDVGQSNK